MAQKVIFDTDPGVDDAAALLFLHQAPQIDLVGVTTVFGNASIETVTRNALYMKARFGISAPVAQGAAEALTRPSEPFPAAIHGVDGLSDVARPPYALPAPDPRSAAQFIVDMLNAHPGEITLCPVGRLTDLAQALAIDPSIAGKARQVVLMGGAFDVAGNASPVAEANILGDPLAADIVFGAAWPVVAIGLDVTHQVLVSDAGLDRLEQSGRDGAGFIAQVSRNYMKFYRSVGHPGMFVHDSSAVAAILRPELFTYRSGPVRVVCDGPAEGMTIQVDPARKGPMGGWADRPHQRVAIAVEGEAVGAMMLESLLAL